MALALATRVAAGMPISTTPTAKTIAAARRQFRGTQCATTAHTIAVASDPQVPGPGCRRPTPKNVAVNLAHAGAEDPCGELTVFSRILLAVFMIAVVPCAPAVVPLLLRTAWIISPAVRQIVLPVLLGFVVFWGVFAGVLDRRRDYVGATGPL